MGNLCDCFNTHQSSSATAKTPLLSGPTSQAVVTSAPGKSARANQPTREEELTTSLAVLGLIQLDTVTTHPAIDKTFKDHVKLYNDLYSMFTELKQVLHDFKAKFEYDTNGIPIIADCLRLLNQRCGRAVLKGSRDKFCIQIQYDRRDVSDNCTVSEPADVLETLDLYNTCNSHIRDVMNRASKVKSSISLILEEEDKLKRDVIKADPDGKQGTEPVRVTNANFAKLHKLPAYIDTIEKYTEKTFKEITSGSAVLFKDVV